MVRIVNPRDSLRLSILAALGVTGCASASPSTSSAGDSAPVVTITPVSSSAPPADSSDPDPGIPVISSKRGWITESNGNVHRASVTSCDPTIDEPACKGTEGHQQCKTDADCSAQRHGKCVSGIGQVGDYCACRYSCANDADCSTGEACVCKGLGRASAAQSSCAPASCLSDSDCESKQCGLSVHNNGCSTRLSLVCRTKSDSCKTDKDCAVRGGQCAAVRRSEDEATWQCAIRSCVIGRPLVVDGSVRAASPALRNDWQSRLEFDIQSLDAETRAAAVDHYADMAAMEHAAIASFARFSLQLMAFGAPADLLQDAYRGALDEVEHARTSYALVSLFGNKKVGPDKLPAAVAPVGSDMNAFVHSLVVEGCVGETLGTAEGREAAQKAKWQDLADALSTIADDEERHATLAWRTLKWALDTFGKAAHDAATRAFAEARAIYGADPPVPHAAAELGMLSGKSLGTLRRQVLSHVVAPCAQALGIPFDLADAS